jgi:hypothetical protein
MRNQGGFSRAGGNLALPLRPAIGLGSGFAQNHGGMAPSIQLVAQNPALALVGVGKIHRPVTVEDPSQLRFE